MSNTDHIIKRPIVKKWHYIILWLFACVLPCADTQGQKTVNFDFKHKKKIYRGDFSVEVQYENKSVKDNDLIENVDFNRRFILNFHSLNLPDFDTIRKATLTISRNDILITGGLRFNPEETLERVISMGSSKRIFPLEPIGEGPVTIEIKAFKLSFLDGSSFATNPFGRAQFNFNISKKKEDSPLPADTPTPATETTTYKSTCDQEWEQRNAQGIEHMIWHVRKYLKEPCAEKNNKREAKRILLKEVRSGNKKRALDAAALYLEYYRGDGYESEVRRRVNEYNQPPPKQDELENVKKEFSDIQGMENESKKEQKFEEFIIKYSVPKWKEKAAVWVDKAKRFVRTQIEPINETDVYLNYAVAPVIHGISDSTNMSAELMVEDGRHRLNVTMFNDGNYHILISDAQKVMKYREEKIPVGNYPKIEPLPVTGDTLYGLSITSGKPPFRIDFYKNNQRLKSVEFESGEIFYDQAALENLLGSQTGDFTVRIVEWERNLMFNGGGFNIPAPEFPWLIVGTAILLFFVIIGIRSLQKRAHRREYEEKLKKAKEEGTAIIEPEVALNNTMDETITPTETQLEMAVPLEEIKAPEMEKHGRSKPPAFVIKKHKIASQQKHGVIELAEDFLSLVSANNYFKFDLTQLWDDTAINELHFHTKSISDLGQFLRSQNIKELIEKEGTIPEIGGFLLGKFFKDPDIGNYKVAVEEFVPVSPKMHNVYKLEFSTSGIAHELGEAQDQFPELVLVAWFHTHPGHGLFLSSPDLTIHEGFFKEKYQFAMEIDSLTDNLDTGFFTRTMAGKTNNRDNRKPSAKWFDWVEVEKASQLG